MEKRIENQLIAGEEVSFSLDDHQTMLNNNSVILGSPGSGKTSSFVIPNVMQAYGSYVISDCKGSVYKKTADYLKKQGYKVYLLDFKSFQNSSCHYNPFHYIKEDDIQGMRKMADVLIGKHNEKDPFWDESAMLLTTSVIAYLVQCCPKRMRTFGNMISLLSMAKIVDDAKKTELDQLFTKLEIKQPDAFCLKEYEKVRTAPQRTFNSIVVTAAAKVGILENPALNALTGEDDLGLQHIGDQKTAIYVNISDTDRSNDILANLFFTQALNQLCDYADMECEGEKLPLPVRFIMDDFGTNLFIPEFPKMVSAIRSRNISASIILQAVSQLEHAYGQDGNTVLAACDTTLYFGGNDLETAKNIAQRAGIPLEDVMYQPIGDVRILRRGKKPIAARRFNMEKHFEYYRKKEKHGRIISDIKDRCILFKN